MSRPATVISTTNGAATPAPQPQSEAAAAVPLPLSPADEEINRCAVCLGPLSNVNGPISQAVARPAGVANARPNPRSVFEIPPADRVPCAGRGMSRGPAS